jgi:hypothetical protein
MVAVSAASGASLASRSRPPGRLVACSRGGSGDCLAAARVPTRRVARPAAPPGRPPGCARSATCKWRPEPAAAWASPTAPGVVAELLARKITAYSFEYFQDNDGAFPLMAATGQIAGQMAVIYATYHLQSHPGGSGISLPACTYAPAGPRRRHRLRKRRAGSSTNRPGPGRGGHRLHQAPARAPGPRPSGDHGRRHARCRRSCTTVGMVAPVSVVRAFMARESTGLIVVTGLGGMTRRVHHNTVATRTRDHRTLESMCGGKRGAGSQTLAPSSRSPTRFLVMAGNAWQRV